MAVAVHIETIAATRVVAGIDRFAVSVEPEPRPRLPVRPGAGAVRVALCAGALLLAGVLAVEILPWSANARSVAPTPAAPIAPPAAPPPRWIDVIRPIQLFDMTSSEFARLPLVYQARRLSNDAARRDLLRYGAFEADAPVLALSILRLGREPDTAPFVTAVAAAAADQALLVTREGPPSALATRFGAFEAADLIVGGHGATRPCLGFRLEEPAAAGTPVAVAGLACGTAAKPMDRQNLACVLDRFDLVSAGEDTDLRAFFVEAERRRGQGCTGSRLLAAGSHPTWLDGESLPPLRPSGNSPPRPAPGRTNAAEL